MFRWQIGVKLESGAFLYLGEADATTIQEACRAFAGSDPDFRACFRPVAMTYCGSPVVPLRRSLIERPQLDLASAAERPLENA